MYWIIIISVAYFVAILLIFFLAIFPWLLQVSFTSWVYPTVITAAYVGILIPIYIWVFLPFLEKTFPHW